MLLRNFSSFNDIRVFLCKQLASPAFPTKDKILLFNRSNSYSKFHKKCFRSSWRIEIIENGIVVEIRVGVRRSAQSTNNYLFT